MDRSHMNPPTDNAPPPAAGFADGQGHAARPENWSEALMTLVASRIALIQLEARETARHGGKRAVCVIVAALCLFFAWILLLAGGIAAISSASGWPWHWLAIAAAAVHVLVAVFLARNFSKPSEPAFPLTRAEFQKDREWIENLQKTPKSNN